MPEGLRHAPDRRDPRRPRRRAGSHVAGHVRPRFEAGVGTMKWLIPILALAACDKDNADYCDEPMVHCLAGVCNQTTHECEPGDGGMFPDFAGTDLSLDFAPRS